MNGPPPPPQISWKEEIYDSIAKRKMPLTSYLLMHPEARLSQADKDAVLAWADGKL